MKLKTRQSVAKRVKLTGSKKLRIRSGGQNHFNSRESAKVTTNKRRDKTLSSTNKRHMAQALPYR